MGAELVLRSEGNIALGLAYLVWAKEVRGGEVLLQTRIILIVNMLMVVGAQVACEMHLTQVLEERISVEEELLAKIAVWMRQYLTMLIVS